MKTLLDLFIGFLRIGVMAFGGAYASIPLVEREVVEINGWLTYEEFGNLLALDELTPGPILINSATFVGTRVAGIPGAVVSTLGSILPSCIITAALLFIFSRYRKLDIIKEIIYSVKCMTVGMISVTVLKAVRNSLLLTGTSLPVDPVMVFLTLCSFYLIRKKEVNPLIVMLGSGAVELAVTFFIG